MIMIKKTKAFTITEIVVVVISVALLTAIAIPSYTNAAIKGKERAAIGNQTGGRVFLFLNTDDFWRDYNEMLSRGIVFVREPKDEPYGTVAVFEDLYGNLWDLLQLKAEEVT